MTKSIENRLEKIEKALSIGKERLVVVIRTFQLDNDKPVEETLGPINEWITYKQAIDTGEDLVVFSPDPQKEIEARQGLH